MQNFLAKLEKINKASSTPLYHQISTSLEKMIEGEKIEPGTKLPSEESLARYFGVNRITLGNAIDLLAKKSLVYKERGKGTFICERKVQLALVREPISFGQALKKAGVDFYTKILELKKIKANPSIAGWLDLKRGSEVIYLKRIRYMHEKPLLLTISHLPYGLFPGLLKEDLDKSSLFSLLSKKYNASVVKAERYMKIVRASEEEAQSLKIPVGDPLLQMEGIAFSSQNRKIEHFNVLVRAERIVFFTTLYEDGIHL